MHEQRIADLHRAVLLALTAVHTGIRNVGEPDKLEHEIHRQYAWRDQVRFLRAALHTVTDRAVFNACIAFDTSRGFGNNFLQALSSFAEYFEIMLSPLVTKLEHRTFYFAPDFNTLRIRRFGSDPTLFHGTVQEISSLIAADLDKCGFSSLVADNPPVSASQICLPRDFHLAP